MKSVYSPVHCTYGILVTEIEMHADPATWGRVHQLLRSKSVMVEPPKALPNVTVIEIEVSK